MKRFILLCLVICLYSQAKCDLNIAVDTNLIVLVADPHVFPGKIKREKDFEADTLEHFTNMVRDVTTMNPRPAAIIFLGDLVEQPTVEAYRLFRHLLTPISEAQIPYYLILGNHDQSAPFFEVFPEWRERTKDTGSLAYRIELPNVDFLTLETTDPTTKDGYFGKIDPNVRTWLQSELRKTPLKSMFIVGHHDVDFGKFFPDLAKEPNFRGWLNGHWHRYLQKTSPEGVRIFWIPSLGFMGWGENPVTGYVLLRIGTQNFTMTLITNPFADKVFPLLAP